MHLNKVLFPITKPFMVIKSNLKTFYMIIKAKPLTTATMLYVSGVLFTLHDFKLPCWYLANLAIALGIFSILPRWRKSNYPIIGLFMCFLKLSVTIYIGYGWWTFEDPYGYIISHCVECPSTEFFWAMPVFIIVWGYFEGEIIRRYFTTVISKVNISSIDDDV